MKANISIVIPSVNIGGVGRGGVTGEDVCWAHTMSAYKELINKFQINHQYGDII